MGNNELRVFIQFKARFQNASLANKQKWKNINLFNSIGGVMINMLALKAVDPGFDP